MSKIKSMRIDDISYDIGADYSNIDNTPTFKTINGEAITGTGNITIEGGSGTPTDVQINGSSITSSGTANIVTEGVYNPSTNKLATMSAMPDITGKQDTLVSGSNIKTINDETILGEGNLTINTLTNEEKNKIDTVINELFEFETTTGSGLIQVTPPKGSKINVTCDDSTNVTKVTGRNLENIQVRSGDDTNPTTVWGRGWPGAKNYLNDLPAGSYTIQIKATVTAVNENATHQVQSGIFVQPIMSQYLTNVTQDLKVGDTYIINNQFVITEKTKGTITNVYIYLGNSADNPNHKYTVTLSEPMIVKGALALDYREYGSQNITGSGVVSAFDSIMNFVTANPITIQSYSKKESTEIDYKYNTGLSDGFKNIKFNIEQKSYTIPSLATINSALNTTVTSAQGGTYYGGVYFQLYSNNAIALIDYETGETINIMQIQSSHGDTIDFSNEFYDANDEFPLALITADSNPAMVYVVRITRTACTLINTLRFAQESTGYYAGHTYDPLNKTIWMVGYTENSYYLNENGTNLMKVSKWSIDNIQTDQPTYVSTFNLPFMITVQNQAMFNGDLWLLSSHNGAGGIAIDTKIYVVDLANQRIKAILNDFPTTIKTHECENFAFVPNGNKYDLGFVENAQTSPFVFKFN